MEDRFDAGDEGGNVHGSFLFLLKDAVKLAGSWNVGEGRA